MLIPRPPPGTIVSQVSTGQRVADMRSSILDTEYRTVLVRVAADCSSVPESG